MHFFRRLTPVIVLCCVPILRADEFQEMKGRALATGSPAYGIAFSKDGQQLALGGGDSRPFLGVYDVATGKKIVDLKGHTNYVWDVSFSPDGKLLASGAEDASARVWDLATGKEVAQVREFAGRVTCVQFSPDGKTLLAGSNDGKAVLYDLASSKVAFRLERHTASVRGAAFSPDGKSCATVGKDKQLCVWNPETGKLRFSTSFPDILYSMAWTPDGKFILVAGGGEGQGDHAIRILNIAERKTVALKGHGDSVWHLSLTADGMTAASSGYHDKTARIWDLSTRTSRAVVKLPDDIAGVAISPDGKILVTSTFSRVQFWQPKEDK